MFYQAFGPHSGPAKKAAICRVRCADQRPRGWRGGRDYDQGRDDHQRLILSSECFFLRSQFMRRQLFLSICVAMAVAAPVTMTTAAEPSAILKQIDGRVLVVESTTTALGQEGMPLFNSNRVITLAGGSAQIGYPDGCTVTLTDNNLLSVAGPSQCSTGQALLSSTKEFQNQHIGQSRYLTSATVLFGQPVSYAALGFGGLVTAGTIGVIVDANQPSHNNTDQQILILLRRQSLSP